MGMGSGNPNNWLFPGMGMVVVLGKASCGMGYQVAAVPPREPVLGSWKVMSSTQPPVACLKTKLRAEPPQNGREVDIGPRLQDLYDACMLDWGGTPPSSTCHFLGRRLEQTRSWLHLHNDLDIDVVTGSRMLEMLAVSSEELRDQKLLWSSDLPGSKMR